MTAPDLVVVHGVFFAQGAAKPVESGDAQTRRAKAFEKYGEDLGVINYEWVDGRNKAVANHLLRLARGTMPAVDAVEILELDEARALASLADDPSREHWQALAHSAQDGLDATRSFILAGAPRQLLDGQGGGQRVLWLGRGLSQLSEAEFIAHYTGRHGPLVASYAPQMGLKRYRQVPNERDQLCALLRQVGFGQAAAPAVFAELVMGAPSLTLASLRLRRRGASEIKADEKRHIDFGRSMLLLA